jgi:CheY-like chemotaxis protein
VGVKAVAYVGVWGLAVTEPMSQPIFFVVDEDPAAVEMLTDDLERRFHADYRVMGETSAAAALERLGALRDSGDVVALIICYERMHAMPGSELLARLRGHPAAGGHRPRDGRSCSWPTGGC